MNSGFRPIRATSAAQQHCHRLFSDRRESEGFGASSRSPSPGTQRWSSLPEFDCQLHSPESARRSQGHLQAGDGKKMDTIAIHSQRFTIAYLEGDAQEMERQEAWASGKNQESAILLQESQVAASRGQLKKARELSQQALDSAKKFDLQSAAASVAAARGVVENWIGDPAAARSWSTRCWTCLTTSWLRPPHRSLGQVTPRGLRKSLMRRGKGAQTILSCSRTGFHRCGRPSRSSVPTRPPLSKR